MSDYPGLRMSGLLTDLYELTMAAGYVQKNIEARATFELFVRHLPPQRNYLVAAGLEEALHFLENVRFSAEDISDPDAELTAQELREPREQGPSCKPPVNSFVY